MVQPFRETAGMASGMAVPDAGRSTPLINSAGGRRRAGNPLRQPCRAAVARAKLTQPSGTPQPELLSYFSLNIDLMRESLAAGQGFCR